MYGTETEPNPQAGRIYSADGISPTLDTCSGGNRMPKIAIPVLTPDRAEKRQNGRRFKANGRRTKGLVKTFIDLNKNPKKTPVARCLKARYNAGVTNRNGENSGVLLTEDWNIDKWAEMMVSTPTPSKEMLELSQKTGWRIRKLTPRECWRLQGFPDWAFERAREAGVSDSQLYKQAGNSVTVNVIKAIGERL